MVARSVFALALCATGVQAHLCSSDESCAATEYCSFPEAPPCLPPFIPLYGECSAKPGCCTSGNSCMRLGSFGSFCLRSFGVCKAREAGCTTHFDCKRGEECLLGKCRPLSVPTPTPQCTSHIDCWRNEGCVMGKCVSYTECTSNADCTGPYHCPGASVAGCTAAKRCVRTVEEGGACGGMDACNADVCSPGLVCKCTEPTCDAPGVCTKPAQSPAPAPTPVVCTTHIDCPRNHQCVLPVPTAACPLIYAPVDPHGSCVGKEGCCTAGHVCRAPAGSSDLLCLPAQGECVSL